MITMWIRGLTLGITVAVGLVVSGCSKDETLEKPDVSNNRPDPKIETTGFETPELAYNSYSTAATKEDFVAMTAALTPDSRISLCGQLCLMISVFGEFDPEGPDACETFLSSHGVHDMKLSQVSESKEENGPAAFMNALGHQVRSADAFIPAAFEFLKKIPDANIKGFGRGTIGKITVLEDTAFATVSTATDTRPIEFRRLNGGWLVQIPESAFALDAGGQLDAEYSDSEPGDDFYYHFDEEDVLTLPAPMTREDFEQEWRQSISLQDTPAIEVLGQIASRAGLKIHDQPHLEEALRAKITIEAEDQSAVQLIERAAAQIGLYPKYKLKTVAFYQGPRPWPAAFAGPFIIVVDNLDVRVPWPVARMELQFFAAGLPEPMISQVLQLNSLSEEDAPNTFTAVTDEIQGGSFQLHEVNTIGYGRRASFKTLMFSHVYHLHNLLRSVQQSKPVTGRISWPFPVESRNIKFGGVNKGDTAESDELSLTISDSILAETSRLSVDINGASIDDITLIGRDANDLPLANNFSSGLTTEKRTVLHVTIEGEPTSLEAVQTTKSDRVTYPFLLPPIHFADFKEMLPKIEELDFEGNTPVAATFNRIVKGDDFDKILLTLENRSNKAVHAVQIRRTYLNADDQRLSSESGVELGSWVLLDVEQSADVEISTAFIPNGAKGVIPDIEFVEFADGTTWEPESESSAEDNGSKDGESAQPPASPSLD